MEAATKDIQDLRKSTQSQTTHVQHDQQYQLTLHRLQNSCYRCGGNNHSAQQCQFCEAKCQKYGKQGHITSVCKSSKKPLLFIKNHIAIGHRATLNVHTLEEVRPSLDPLDVNDEENQSTFPVYTVDNKSSPLECKAFINEEPVVMEIEINQTYSSKF